MVKKVVLLLSGTVFFSALLTPLVCDALIAIFSNLPYPFSRVFDRVALVVVFTLLFVFRKYFGVGNFREDVAREVQRWREILLGISLSVLCGLFIIAYYLYQGTIFLDVPGAGYLLKKLLPLLPIALLIATIEEVFFRGVLLKQMRQSTGLLLAVGLSSALYAFVHFVAPLKGFQYSAGNWWQGFVYVGSVLSRMGSFDLFSSMLGLWFVGVVLCSVAVRRKSLAAAIGLHAGWIICLKLVTYLTEWGPELVNASKLGKRYFIVGDLPGWICVTLVGLVALRLFPEMETEHVKE